MSNYEKLIVVYIKWQCQKPKKNRPTLKKMK